MTESRSEWQDAYEQGRRDERDARAVTTPMVVAGYVCMAFSFVMPIFALPSLYMGWVLGSRGAIGHGVAVAAGSVTLAMLGPMVLYLLAA